MLGVKSRRVVAEMGLGRIVGQLGDEFRGENHFWAEVDSEGEIVCD